MTRHWFIRGLSCLLLIVAIGGASSCSSVSAGVSRLTAQSGGSTDDASSDRRPTRRQSIINRNYLKAGDEMLKAFRPAVINANRATVTIQVDRKDRVFGTIIDSSGLIVTKASELDGDLRCVLHSGKKLDTRIVAEDRTFDLALLKVSNGDPLPVAKWAPDDYELVAGRWAVSAGTDNDALAFGAISVLPRKIDKGRAYLGVMLDDDENGALIRELTHDMGAEAAGLLPGDVLTHINGIRITGRQQVPNMLSRFDAGDTVKVKANRNDKSLLFEVEMRSLSAGAFGTRRGISQSMLQGPLSTRAKGFGSVFQHDAVIRPYECGGPVVNLDGEVIGINIARADRVSTYAIPSDVLTKRIAKMKLDARKAVRVSN